MSAWPFCGSLSTAEDDVTHVLWLLSPDFTQVFYRASSSAWGLQGDCCRLGRGGVGRGGGLHAEMAGEFLFIWKYWMYFFLLR